MARFHRRLRFGSQRCGTDLVSPAKSGRDPDWAVLKGCRQVRATHALRWLVVRIVTSVRHGDNNKQTKYPQGFILDNGHVAQPFSLGEQGGGDVLKLLLDDFQGSSWFNVKRSSFPLFVLSRLHCVALLWCHNVYVAATAIDIWPTIRVLSAVETRADTELGYTAPSLPDWGEPNRIAPSGGNAP